MKRSDFSNNDSEVLDLFAEIVEREKLLDKTAEYGLLPEGLFDSNKAGQELDLNMAVIASAHSQLYGVTSETGEQLVGDAHPKNTKTQLDNNKPEKGLDVVETIVEQHKINEGIATKTPSGKLAALSERLSKLADIMDQNGFEILADQVDGMIKVFADAGLGPAGYDAAQKPASIKPWGYETDADRAEKWHKERGAKIREEMLKQNPVEAPPEAAPEAAPEAPKIVMPETKVQGRTPVTKIQEEINKKLPPESRIPEDGKWGPRTQQAFVSLEAAPGAKTWQELVARIQAAPGPRPE